MKNIKRKKIYHAILEYCLTKDSEFELALNYDSTVDFVDFCSKFVGSSDDGKTYRAICRAKTCLIQNGWLIKRQIYNNKQYAGEPAVGWRYEFPKQTLRDYEIAKLSNETDEFLDSIPTWN